MQLVRIGRVSGAGLGSHMQAGVRREMVTAAEWPRTHTTHIRPRVCVLARMPHQLVLSAKAPLAAGPGAGKRPLARVGPRVGA